MPEFDIDPIPAPEPEPKPDEPGPTTAELEAKLKEQTTKREAAEAQALQYNNAYTSLALQTAQQMQATGHPDAPPIDTPLPDPEEDPDAYQQALIDKRVQAAIAKERGPVDQALQQTAGVAYQTAIQQDRLRMQTSPDAYPGYAEMETEIDQFLAQFPMEQQALPNARAEAYYRLKGKKDADKEIQDNRRQQAATSIARTTSVAPAQGPGETALDDKAKSFAARAGMTDKEFSSMRGGGRMSIDDFKSSKESK